MSCKTVITSSRPGGKSVMTKYHADASLRNNGTCSTAV